jgi:excinuclease ABC subunit A
VLQAGRYQFRPRFDPQSVVQERDGDLEISDVGRAEKMPWERDGRRWHTQDRVGRNGQACRWDGRILARTVDRIQESGAFSETNWSARSVVEIAALKKSDGWFFHAITGETWLLKLKFRVCRNTFKRDILQRQLDLKPLNQLDQLPVYGNQPRVQCKNLRGPWQEVQIQAYSLEEVDTPAFWNFVQQAIDGFRRHTARAATRPEDIMPWKKLGERWHFSRKGFPPGKRVCWGTDVLEELCELLRQTAPDGQFLWNNQQVVHLYARDQREPWASIHTKRSQHVELVLNGPKGRFALGRVAGLARERQLEAGRGSLDVIRLRFRSQADLQKGDLAEFLREHLQEVQGNGEGR